MVFVKHGGTSRSESVRNRERTEQMPSVRRNPSTFPAPWIASARLTPCRVVLYHNVGARDSCPFCIHQLQCRYYLSRTELSTFFHENTIHLGPAYEPRA